MDELVWLAFAVLQGIGLFRLGNIRVSFDQDVKDLETDEDLISGTRRQDGYTKVLDRGVWGGD